ncbi:MAG: hypothetical protein ACYC5A_10095 [Thermoleophilia bacterium]
MAIGYMIHILNANDAKYIKVLNRINNIEFFSLTRILWWIKKPYFDIDSAEGREQIEKLRTQSGSLSIEFFFIGIAMMSLGIAGLLGAIQFETSLPFLLLTFVMAPFAFVLSLYYVFLWLLLRRFENERIQRA